MGAHDAQQEYLESRNAPGAMRRGWHQPIPNGTCDGDQPHAAADLLFYSRFDGRAWDGLEHSCPAEEWAPNTKLVHPKETLAT